MVKNLVVLVSGRGTNFYSIAQAIEKKIVSNYTIIKLIADRECAAVVLAQELGISTQIIRRGFFLENDLKNALPVATDIILLAGFLSILPASFVENWKNKILNIHPSLLPAYGGKGMYGERVHQAVIQAKEAFTGVTVHWVTEEIDEGEIILQNKMPIHYPTTPKKLAEKVLELEHKTLLEALQRLNT